MAYDCFSSYPYRAVCCYSSHCNCCPFGVYYKISSDAVSAYQAKETAQSLERVDEAIKAGDRVDAIDSSPDGLRSPDAFERK